MSMYFLHKTNECKNEFLCKCYNYYISDSIWLAHSTLTLLEFNQCIPRLCAGSIPKNKVPGPKSNAGNGSILKYAALGPRESVKIGSPHSFCLVRPNLYPETGHPHYLFLHRPNFRTVSGHRRHLFLYRPNFRIQNEARTMKALPNNY